MTTGFTGTFVMSWSQAELDGLKAAPLSSLRVGAVWSWTGNALRVDGPNEVLRLGQSDEDRTLHRRAARMVRRLIGEATSHAPSDDDLDPDAPLVDGGFVLTDGHTSLIATLIQIPGAQPLVMFLDALPVAGRDYWIAQVYNIAAGMTRQTPDGGGVICFTPGTRIATPYGPTRVEDLRPGDRVLTKDNGPSEILWTGARRLTGARLYTDPSLRPVRIRSGAFGIDRPDSDLLVSPDHRLLVKGPAAQTLFNTPEVLVTARDLIHGTAVRQITSLKEVTYIHLLLDAHQVIWANSVETESFHPASAALPALTDADRATLLSGLPDLANNPMSYGHYARRNLTKSEAAILLHDAA